MKILYCGDIHSRTNCPRFRIDDFYSNQLKKHQELVDIINTCDAAILGGDVFDSPTPSTYLVNDLLSIWKKVKNIPIYVCLGSHDIEGYNFKTYHKSGLGVFEKFGIFRIMNYQEEITLEGIPISFYPHLGELKLTDLLPSSKIYVIHNYITKEKLPFTLYTMDQITLTNKIFFVAHYHKPFFEKVNGNIFISTGVLTRCDISERDYVITPIILDTVTKKLQPIKMKTVLSGVFVDADKINFMKQSKMDFEKFKASIKQGLNISKSGIELLTEILNITEDGNIKKIIKEAYDVCSTR